MFRTSEIACFKFAIFPIGFNSCDNFGLPLKFEFSTANKFAKFGIHGISGKSDVTIALIKKLLRFWPVGHFRTFSDFSSFFANFKMAAISYRILKRKVDKLTKFVCAANFDRQKSWRNCMTTILWKFGFPGLYAGYPEHAWGSKNVCRREISAISEKMAELFHRQLAWNLKPKGDHLYCLQ